MYEQSIASEEQNAAALQLKLRSAKRKRRQLELEVQRTTANSNLLQSKIDRQNVKQSMFSHIYNKFYTAAEVRKELRREHRIAETSRRSNLEQLQRQNSHAKSLRDCRAKQVKHSLLISKNTSAKLDRSTLTDSLSRTIEDREEQKRGLFHCRLRQMLDGVYRIENITSKDVQRLYLRTIDDHKRHYQDRLSRRTNLLRVKDELGASGLYRRLATE